MEIQDERTTSTVPHPACTGAADRWTTPGAAPADAPLALRDRPRAGLTALETDVLNGLAAGLSEREIALSLMLFESAVRATLRSIVRKLRVRSRAEAVAHAAPRRRGI